MIDKTGKIAVITGGTGGIGKAAVELLVKNDFAVAFTYNKNKKGAKELEKKFPNKATGFKCNTTKEQNCKKTIAQIIKKFNRIDVLINNAGAWNPKPFETMDSKNWKKALDTNLTSYYYFTKAAFPFLKKQKNAKIINVASIAGITGSLLSPPYAAAKGGVIAFSYTIAREFAKYNITVNCIAPGPTKTNLLLNNVNKAFVKKIKSETPLGRIAQPQDIAKVILFFSLELSDFVTGQTLIVDGGRLMR